MLPMLQKHAVITAALLASLSLTACGSKKELNGAPAKSEKTTTSDTNGSLGGGLPDPNGPISDLPAPTEDYYPPVPGPIPGGTATPPKTETPKAQTPPPPPAPPKASTPSYPPPPTSSVPVNQPAPVVNPPVAATRNVEGDLNQIPTDYNSNDYRNATRDNLSKRMTGAVTPEGLVYTSSSTDELLNYLRARNQKVGAVSRQQNLDAAASIQSAKMSIDSLSGDISVTLKVQEGSSVRTYNVAGGVGSDVAMPVRSVRAANGEKTTGSRPVSGTAKCVDLDGGCENVYVRLELGAKGSSGIVNLVFRNSAADLYFHLPAKGQHSDNPEFLVLQDYMINTIRQVNTTDKIKSVRLNSWEVVNGRSGFAVSMKGANNELLAFAGPLLAPEAGTGVNIGLSRIAKENNDDSLDLISLNNSKLNYANTIADARLIANNGLGQIRISLKMRKRSNFAQDQVAVTFMRKIKPLVDLTEDNLLRTSY